MYLVLLTDQGLDLVIAIQGFFEDVFARSAGSAE